VPAEARWGYPGAAEFAEARSWLGSAPGADPRPRALVLRYLAAFGPATAADMQTWSGLPSLHDAFEELRPKLRTFRDERGRELFDVPKAPRPPARTAAPVRFLPDYDNLVLGHADRTRLVADEHRPALVTRNLQIPATFLVDGFVAGTWRVEAQGASATLLLRPFEGLPAKARGELITEGARLLRFVEEDAQKLEVRVAGSG
jgi:hypothetical protein